MYLSDLFSGVAFVMNCINALRSLILFQGVKPLCHSSTNLKSSSCTGKLIFVTSPCHLSFTLDVTVVGL